MIILDTNVISELMREEPHKNVKEWVAAHKPTDLSLTTIAIAEIQKGLIFPFLLQKLLMIVFTLLMKKLPIFMVK